MDREFMIGYWKSQRLNVPPITLTDVNWNAVSHRLCTKNALHKSRQLAQKVLANFDYHLLGATARQE